MHTRAIALTHTFPKVHGRTRILTNRHACARILEYTRQQQGRRSVVSPCSRCVWFVWVWVGIGVCGCRGGGGAGITRAAMPMLLQQMFWAVVKHPREPLGYRMGAALRNPEPVRGWHRCKHPKRPTHSTPRQHAASCTNTRTCRTYRRTSTFCAKEPAELSVQPALLPHARLAAGVGTG